MSGVLKIREGATHKVVLGPVVAVGDGFTPVTTLAVSSADEAEAILHDNGTVVDISGYTWAAITTADGYYHLTLQTGITNTIGHLTIAINDDSLCLPVKGEFEVLTAEAYDVLYASSSTGIPDYSAYVPTGPAPLFGVIEGGTAQSATSTTLVGRAAATNDSVQAGMTILAYGSTQDHWQSVMIDSVSADTFTVAAWPIATPSGTITYIVMGTPTVSSSVLPPVNVVQISGDSVAADNLESYCDGTTPQPVNATQVSGDSTAADNLEAAFDGTGYDVGGIDVSELNAIVDDLINGGRLDLLVDAIKAKTDSLTFTVSNQIDSNMQSINDVAITGDGGSGTEFDV